MKNSKVWLVTGASKGLGLELVRILLSKGYNVAATSRNKEELIRAVHEEDKSFLPLQVNLSDEKSISAAVAQTLVHFSRIDVLVNNAGYGMVGSLEEASDKESRENFEVNVFGTLNMIRAVMPHFRAQKSGHIFNIGSIAGYTSNFPGFGIYCATKFAVQGLTGSLAAESKQFNVHATVVYPGYFRTSFLTPDSLRVPANPIGAYVDVRAIQDKHQHEIDGNQAGDPRKAAEVLIKAAESAQPPVHLFLGQDAYNLAYAQMEEIRNALETWKEDIVNTAY